ncbi:MAG: hypothetical protein HY791_33715 [Deltaproteobacteria bacterium]|nr:hypothetical protein [Deltaproteobacteria bacterium]
MRLTSEAERLLSRAGAAPRPLEARPDASRSRSTSPSVDTFERPRPFERERDGLAPDQKAEVTSSGSESSRRYFGVYFPDGRQLTGWDLLDGSAKAAGMGHLAEFARFDVACLFAFAMARGLKLSDEERTHILTDPPFGAIDGALLGMIPRDELRRALDTLVDAELAKHWLSVADVGTGSSNPFASTADPLVKRALHPTFVSETERANGKDDELWTRLQSGGPEVDEELRARFVDGLVRELETTSPELGGKISLAHTDESLSGDAARVLRAALARARTLRLEDPDRSRVPAQNLVRALASPSERTAALLTRLEEGLVARVARRAEGVANFHLRRAPTRPGDALLDALEKVIPKSAALRRDVRSMLPAAIEKVMSAYSRDGSIDARAAAKALGPAAADLLFAVADDLGPARGALDPFHGELVGAMLAPLHTLDPSAARNVVFGDRLEAPKIPFASLAGFLLVDAPPYLELLATAVRNRNLESFGLYDRDQKLRGQGVRFLESLKDRLDLLGGSSPGADAANIGSALLDELASCVDVKGRLDVARVYAEKGELAGRLTAIMTLTVDGKLQSKELDPDTALPKAPTRLAPDTLAAIGRGPKDVAQRKRMPALDAISAEVSRTLGAKSGAKSGPPLAGWKAVVLQHLFPTTVGMVDALVENGLQKDRFKVIGKSYSTSDSAFGALEGRGIAVDPRSRANDAVGSDAAATLARIAEDQLGAMFSDVTNEELESPSSKPRFLLVDEGGNLVSTLLEKFPRYARLCAAMEHTERGMQRLDAWQAEHGQLPLVVVDMARSVAKKSGESPMIGESVVFSAEQELRDAGVSPPAKREATVLGYGAVGRSVAAALKRRGFEVFTFDPRPEARKQAKADGVAAPTGPNARREALAHGHMVYSCTGRTSIEPRELASMVPNGAVLVNAGSGTHELGVSGLATEELAARTAQEGLSADGSSVVPFGDRVVATGKFRAPGEHRHLVFVDEAVVRGKKQKTEHLVLRGGAVVNMTRDIPPEYVQLTRALVLASALQAAKETRTGVVPLDPTLAKVAVDATAKELRKKGLPPLDHPDFRECDNWA